MLRGRPPKTMIKDGKCRFFQKNKDGRCKYYAGDKRNMESCYTRCLKRKRDENE
jgi:hypothetical protein